MPDQVFAIVGAGLAGANTAQQLRGEGFDGRIVLIGEEPERPYERPPLSKEYLRGEQAAGAFEALDESFYAEHDIDLRTSTRVSRIDLAAREVVLGEEAMRQHYDQLLIATGSDARRLRVPGHDLPGVHYLRTIEDADALRDAAGQAERVVVVGSGWIGAEVSASLRQLGLAVTMVGRDAAPLARVLGPEVSSLYRDLHREHGVELIAGVGVAALRGDEVVRGVETDDGRRIDADLVVVGIGSQPRTELAVAAGLEVERGIVVDATLRASAPGVYAAGDVAAAWHPVLETRLQVEHWDNARRQGRHAARSMLGARDPFVRLPYFYSDQFDLGMEYRGYAVDWDRVVFRGAPERREFIAFWLKDGRVTAAMNANIWKVGKPLAALIESGRRVDVQRLQDDSVPLDDLDALTTRQAAS